MKEYFLKKYDQIHENLRFLENEIESCTKDKDSLIKNPDRLEDLKKRVLVEIEILNKTREDEKKQYNY